MTCAEVICGLAVEVYTFSAETYATIYCGIGHGVMVGRTEAAARKGCHMPPKTYNYRAHLRLYTTILRQKEQSQLNDPALFVSLIGILLVTDTPHTHILPDGGTPPVPPLEANDQMSK